MTDTAPRVIAIIAAYNEEDIIDRCLEHLAAQGVESYLLDDGSTDRTIERAQRWRGRGLIDIERLSEPPNPVFSLRRILARKESLAVTLAADWFINHDADEFRESPWAELTLQQALGRVVSLGYNAVDFEIFTILPQNQASSQARYVPAGAYDRRQVRAWQAGPSAPVLVESAGHDVAFEGRRVFPIRFPMRHYPVRSPDHGERKIAQERLPRFDPAERSAGWHLQYDERPRAHEESAPFDPSQARILSALSNREIERLANEVDVERARHGVTAASLARVREELTAAVSRADALARQYHDASQRASTAEHELDAVHASKSWRWTRPLRRLLSFATRS